MCMLWDHKKIEMWASFYPDQQFCRPSYWDIFSLALHTASKTQPLTLTSSDSTREINSLLACLFFFYTAAYMLCKEGWWERPLLQLWLTSENRSTCIRQFQGVEGSSESTCATVCHCCSSPWFLRSVSSLGQHLPTNAFGKLSSSDEKNKSSKPIQTTDVIFRSLWNLFGAMVCVRLYERDRSEAVTRLYTWTVWICLDWFGWTLEQSGRWREQQLTLHFIYHL